MEQIHDRAMLPTRVFPARDVPLELSKVSGGCRLIPWNLLVPMLSER